MSRSIKSISEELGKKNLEHEKIHYKGKELNLNSGKNNDQHYSRRVNADCFHFVNKGLCRYGSLCKFSHPEKKSVWNPSKAKQADSQVLSKRGIPIHVPSRRIPFPEKIKIPVDPTGLPLSQADSHVLPKSGIPINVPYRIPFSEKFNIPVGPTGLPLRSGRHVCKYYSHFGLCKYGIQCQDDHPIDFKSVAVPVPQRSIKRRDPHK